MKITGMEIQQLVIPFRMSFKHASAERSRTQSVWVRARSAGGRVGLGESCPRTYVTGEDLPSVRRFFDEHAPCVQADITDETSLRSWMAAHEDDIDRSPAAWCAMELALLDLIARERDVPIEELLGLEALAGAFAYTAVVGDSSDEAFANILGRYRQLNFERFKLKVSGDLDRDRNRLGAFGARERVRLDANNLWQTAAEAAAYLDALGRSVQAIEEPLQPNDYDGLTELAQICAAPIILDESFVRAGQFESLRGPTDRWVINLRVSKMGGLIRALDVATEAARRGHRIVVGSQVGETSLLTRAGLTVAHAAGSNLWAQEGAFSSLLLETDICHPPIMFGDAGLVAAAELGGAGFGLDVDPDCPFLEPL